MLDSEFEDIDLEQLQEMLDKFDDGVQDHKVNYTNLREAESGVKLKIADLRDGKNDLTAKIGGLEAEENNQKNLLRSRTKSVKELVKHFDVALPRGVTDESAMTEKQHESFLKSLETKKGAFAKELAELKKNNQEVSCVAF